MRSIGFRVSAAWIAVLAAAWLSGPAWAQPNPGKTLVERFTGSKWVKVASPSPSGGDQLNDVDAISGAKAWAVGVHGQGQTSHPLIEQWNGSKWSVASGPSTSGGSDLFGVAVVSSSDAWAVGTEGGASPLIERWNGSSWAGVTGANAQGGSLAAVDAVSATDVWAVGSINGAKALIEHWDGANWTESSAPNTKGPAELTGVAAIAANDVWAVGSTNPNSPQQKPLTIHWNGTAWSLVKSPAPNQGGLRGVAARGGKDIFAAGIYLNAKGCLRTLVVHWNGSAWKQMSTPNPFTCDNELDGIAASSKAVFAVGNHPQHCPGSACKGVTLVSRFVNGSWKLQKSPSTAMKINVLYGAAVVPGKALAWGVGVATNSFSV